MEKTFADKMNGRLMIGGLGATALYFAYDLWSYVASVFEVFAAILDGAPARAMGW